MIDFLHRMGDGHPRTVSEYALLTDWQIVNLFMKPAAKIAREHARAMGKWVPEPEECDAPKPVKWKDKDGNPAPRPRERGIKEIMARLKCSREVAETEYQLYLARWNRYHAKGKK